MTIQDATSFDIGTSEQRANLLATLILNVLSDASDGHCVRVDFLDRDEARAICQYLRDNRSSGLRLLPFVLGSGHDTQSAPLFLTVDRAVELRNRKQGCLCLFVPADLVDATISSLGNSFAQIHGRDLYREALDVILAQLTAHTRDLVQSVRRTLYGSSRASVEAMLDFALAARILDQQAAVESLGLELWRVGLISDLRANFASHLPKNRDAVMKLTHPQQLTASFRDRVHALGVDANTTQRLEKFFAGQSMHEVAGWSRALAEHGLTFDRWIYPDTVDTDLMSVFVRPFTDATGAVLKGSKLSQPDKAGGTLFAHVGPKETLSIRWDTEPSSPRNVHAWRVAMEARSDESDFEALLFDLPSREVKGTSRTARVKLDLEFDEPPETPVQVRVVAIDSAGNEISDPQGHPLEGLSEEFYLTDRDREESRQGSERRQTVSSIAAGRLQAALDTRQEIVALTQPSWPYAKGVLYFSIRANERILLNLATSQLMRDLQRSVIAEPRAGGRYRLQLDEIESASYHDLESVPIARGEGEAWAEFWTARRGLFERLRRVAPRDVFEAVDWSPELTNSAVAHARTYMALVSSLSREDASEEARTALRDALSVDTLSIRLGVGEEIEAAVVVLPTHPLRALWYASYAALLRHWEEAVLVLPPKQRRATLDLRALDALVPANLPAFIHTTGDAEPFVFFHGLGHYYGVALPPDIPDPQRRYLDVALVLGLDALIDESDASRPQRLASHVRDYQASHPYADPLDVTLVNPDRGQFLASTIEHLLSKADVQSEEGDPPPIPSFNIEAYLVNGATSGMEGLDRVRVPLQDRAAGDPTDYLQPTLSSTVHPLVDIDEGSLADAHLAVISDSSRPAITLLPDTVPEGQAGSFSLYGLLTRFVSSFEADESQACWNHRICAVIADKPEPHPAGARFSDVLTEAHRAYLRGIGRLIDSETRNDVPALRVTIDRSLMAVLEHVHECSDWVITVDRFLGVEYYDSPRDSALGTLALKYLIDYTPEFVEGLGHRILVSTSRKQEVTAILRRAMEDLGFAAVESSVSRLLSHLKTVSGRLALQALSHDSNAAGAVSLGAVTAWLESKQRLSQSIMVPIDLHRDLFWPGGVGPIALGERRCDLALFTLRRGIVEVTFIEVKWRRGPLGDISDLVQDMSLQMEATGKLVEERFFNPEHIDGALQRARLANVLRFYANRSLRYGLLAPEAAVTIGGHLTRLEKAGLEFRARHEGFVISLEDPPRAPIVYDNVTVRVLSALDFDGSGPDLVVEGGGDVISRKAFSPEINDFPDSRHGDIGVQRSEAFGDLADLKSSSPEISAEESSITLNAEEVVGAQTASLSTVDRGVSVALGQAGGGEILWTPSVKGSPHLFITGIPGQGKSWTTLRLLTELSRHYVPSLVFDFHGQFADNNLKFENSHPVIVDASKGLPFSPFECSDDNMSPTGATATAMAVSEIFAYVCGLGDIQRDALYQVIRDAYKAHGFGSDDTILAPIRFPTMRDISMRIERAEQANRTQNLAARCRPLLELDLFRPSGEGDDAIFIDRARDGLIVDLHNLYSETLQVATGAFLLRKIYRDMFSWGMADRLRLAIVLDEAHRLVRDATLPKIMKEGRKFGIAVILASQGLTDFHPDVLGNAGTKIAFRANYPESRKVAGFFRMQPGLDAKTVIESLQVGNAVVQTPEMQVAARVVMYPPSDQQ